MNFWSSVHTAYCFISVFLRISSAVMPDDSRSSGTVATLGMGHMDNDTDRIMYDFRLV